MIKKLSEESKGELFIMLQILLYAYFPLVISHTTKLMPPLLFAAVSCLVAAAALSLYILQSKQSFRKISREAWRNIFGLTFFIQIFPVIFIFIGSSLTSTINTTILLQSEIIFTFIICGLFFGESVTWKKILAALIVVIGATLVVYNGSEFKFNLGDFLVIAGTAFYPIGNIYSKKALKQVNPSMVLFLRSVLGGIILLILSMLFEKYKSTVDVYISENIINILLNGIAINFISKMLWYYGLKRLDITKAITLNLSGPAFSLIYAYLFFKEAPTSYQLVGFVIVMIGLFFITKKSSNKVCVES